MIRLAKIEDYDFFYNIKSEKTNLLWSGHQTPPNYKEFKHVFINFINSPTRDFYIVEKDANPCGYLYADLKGDEVELSFAISEKFQGYGLATKALTYAINKYSKYKIYTHVLNNNIASLKVHEKVGFINSGIYQNVHIATFSEQLRKIKFIIPERTFIIAEAGVNHNGDINLAKQLIDKAVEANADAVKFQTWKTELLVGEDAVQSDYQKINTKREESQYQMLKKLELSYDDFKELKRYCDYKNIMFLSTPDESSSADFLEDLQDIYKIGSGELTNIPFLKHIGAKNKKIILSTGMSSLGDIEIALDTLITAGTPIEKITLLHATTQYPTLYSEVNLKAIKTIKSAFKTNVGYSDHTMGIEIPIAAVAMGASVIEKHFTLSRDMEGPDHIASLEPDELKEMVNAIRNIEKALGNGVKKPQISELENLKVVRKSIIASQPIKKGELYTEKNLTTRRMSEGISARLWEEIIGLSANKDYDTNQLITL